MSRFMGLMLVAVFGAWVYTKDLDWLVLLALAFVMAIVEAIHAVAKAIRSRR